jgi:hypothetical protein
MAKSTRSKDQAERDILAQAREDWDAAWDREQDNIRLAYDDLAFLAADNYSQWPAELRQKREAEYQPVLQINELPQFVHQITGDIRQMRPAIKVVPVDSGSDEKIASLRGGLIRYIENRSDAPAVYFRSADSQVACGIGHWKIITEYADRSTFNQEIRIAPVDDGVSVLWDPDASLPTKEDARFCFEPVDMTRGAFEKQWPDIVPSDFDNTEWTHNSQWCTDDYVRVAAYWVKEADKKLLALSLDGAIADLTEADESAINFHMAKGDRIEERDSYRVSRYLITASNILEWPDEPGYPGRFIPIVPVIGEEIRIGRKIIRKGIVRDAKDPQRMSNYFHSAHTEVVALQPKAPFIGTTVNFAKNQSMWETANSENSPYLAYEPDAKNGGVRPERVQPPVSSQGILDGLQMSRQDLRSVIGIYDAGLGEKSNETSGKAIVARQREGDVGSYLYIDNFARAIRQTGNIINDLIPYIYDTERTIRIMGEDGKIDVIDINKAQGLDETGQTVYDHDITQGSYDVVSQIGPSYSTRREEAREAMIEFVRAAPDAGAMIIDLLAKAHDFPMADDIAKRLRANLPPQILAMEEAEKQGMDPEEARKQVAEQMQPPPDPAVLKIQADQEANAQKLAFDKEAKAIDAEQEQARMQQEAALKQAEMQQAAMFKQAELEQQERLEERKLQAQLEIERAKLESSERVAMRKAQMDAEAKERDAHMRAAVAKYQTDNKPEPRAQ